MIAITRSRAPNDIPTGFRGAGRSKKELVLLQARQDHLTRLLTDSNAKNGYKSSWWKPAKKQLAIESSGKCAYCEARADAVAHCDVEHFRPKSIWWWLTCCWENYLFACQICNQSYKNDAFSLAGTISAAPVNPTVNTSAASLASMAGKLAPDPLDPAEITAWLKSLKSEQSNIIEPSTMDPEEWLAYEEDDIKGEVKVIPRTNSAKTKRIANASIELFGLNREELRQLRYETFEALQMAHDSLQFGSLTATQSNKIRRRLERFVHHRHAFAGMCRYYLIDVWQILPATARN